MSRFAHRMEAEIAAHEGDGRSAYTAYTEIKFDVLIEKLRHHADRLHWALQARLKAKNENELRKAIEEIEKHAAHVGNFAMFVFDNAAMGRSL